MEQLHCPSCGHSWPGSVGGSDEVVVCPACMATVPAAHIYHVDPTPPPPRPSPSIPETPLLKVSNELGIDPSLMLDGALGGAIGGIVVGIIVGVSAGVHRYSSTLLGSVGGAVTGILTGFLMGFAAGIFVGALIGLSHRHVQPVFTLTSQRSTLFSGIITGAVVAAFLGSWHWIPFGLAVGGTGALLWSLAKIWGKAFLPNDWHEPPAPWSSPPGSTTHVPPRPQRKDGSDFSMPSFHGHH